MSSISALCFSSRRQSGCLLVSKVGLQLVKATEHLCALQKEVRLQLELFACGTRNCRALGVGIPEHLPSAPCFHKTVDGLCPSLPKKLVQLKKLINTATERWKFTSAADVHNESDARELRSGHGHVD